MVVVDGATVVVVVAVDGATVVVVVVDGATVVVVAVDGATVVVVAATSADCSPSVDDVDGRVDKISSGTSACRLERETEMGSGWDSRPAGRGFDVDRISGISIISSGEPFIT